MPVGNLRAYYALREDPCIQPMWIVAFKFSFNTLYKLYILKVVFLFLSNFSYFLKTKLQLNKKLFNLWKQYLVRFLNIYVSKQKHVWRIFFFFFATGLGFSVNREDTAEPLQDAFA